MTRGEVKFSVGLPVRFHIQIGDRVFEVTIREEGAAAAEQPDFLAQAKATQRALQQKLKGGGDE